MQNRLVQAFVAITILAIATPAFLFVRNASQIAEIHTNHAPPAPSARPHAEDIYCARKGPDNTLLISIGRDCVEANGPASTHDIEVSESKEQGALVVTGADL